MSLTPPFNALDVTSLPDIPPPRFPLTPPPTLAFPPNRSARDRRARRLQRHRPSAVERDFGFAPPVNQITRSLAQFRIHSRSSLPTIHEPARPQGHSSHSTEQRNSFATPRDEPTSPALGTTSGFIRGDPEDPFISPVTSSMAEMTFTLPRPPPLPTHHAFTQAEPLDLFPPLDMDREKRGRWEEALFEIFEDGDEDVDPGVEVVAQETEEEDPEDIENRDVLVPDMPPREAPAVDLESFFITRDVFGVMGAGVRF